MFTNLNFGNLESLTLKFYYPIAAILKLQTSPFRNKIMEIAHLILNNFRGIITE